MLCPYLEAPWLPYIYWSVWLRQVNELLRSGHIHWTFKINASHQNTHNNLTKLINTCLKISLISKLRYLEELLHEWESIPPEWGLVQYRIRQLHNSQTRGRYLKCSTSDNKTPLFLVHVQFYNCSIPSCGGAFAYKEGIIKRAISKA